jgi:hypothetical protein
MPIFTFVNNLNTTLAGSVSTSAATITLASTANLPASIPAGEVLVVTLNDVATRQNYEVMYATARTGATLTVLRAQEGTAALSWLTGDFVFSPPTAGQQASFGQIAEANSWTGNNTFTQPVVVPNAVTTAEAINLGQGEATFAALAGLATQLFSAAPGVSGDEVVNFSQFQSGTVGSGNWLQLPNGWVLQMFTISISSGGTVVNLPKPFTTVSFGLVVTINTGSSASLASNGYVGGQYLNLSQVELFTVNGAPSVTVFAMGI